MNASVPTWPRAGSGTLERVLLEVPGPGGAWDLLGSLPQPWGALSQRSLGPSSQAHPDPPRAFYLPWVPLLGVNR